MEILSSDDFPDRDDLIDRAALGQQVEAFWASRIGDYLRTRAIEYYNAGIEELKSVDPTDYRAVLNAQKKVQIGEGFEMWLSQAVQDGLVALQLLDEEDNG